MLFRVDGVGKEDWEADVEVMVVVYTWLPHLEHLCVLFTVLSALHALYQSLQYSLRYPFYR